MPQALLLETMSRWQLQSPQHSPLLLEVLELLSQSGGITTLHPTLTVSISVNESLTERCLFTVFSLTCSKALDALWKVFWLKAHLKPDLYSNAKTNLPMNLPLLNLLVKYFF